MLAGLAGAIAGCTASTQEPAPVVGRRAPEFTLPALNGTPVALASLRGRPLVLNFMATWCGPCRDELPAIQALTGRHKELAVLLVDLAEDPEDVSIFLESLRVALPTVVDEGGHVSKAYRVRGLPSTFFLDRDGVVRAVQLGALDVRTLDAGVSKIA
jgi:cytochrome c biogenesis protein CcmG/thiol:disulfide interchange protein DsbE